MTSERLDDFSVTPCDAHFVLTSLHCCCTVCCFKQLEHTLLSLPMQRERSGDPVRGDACVRLEPA
jgi:hypothetical protein